MTREEQKAKESKKHYCDDINCYHAFLHGAEWADKHPVNVWHDASEEPQEDGWILVQFSTDVYDTLALPRDVDVWRDFIKMRNFARWAYISDLFPKGGAE